MIEIPDGHLLYRTPAGEVLVRLRDPWAVLELVQQRFQPGADYRASNARAEAILQRRRHSASAKRGEGNV